MNRRDFMKRVFAVAAACTLVDEKILEVTSEKGVALNEPKDWRILLVRDDDKLVWGSITENVEWGDNGVTIKSKLNVTETMSIKGYRAITPEGLLFAPRLFQPIHVVPGDSIMTTYNIVGVKNHDQLIKNAGQLC